MAPTEEGNRGCYRRLAVIFLIWKAVLFTLAAVCPGPGYDTSALILLDPSVARHENFADLTRHERLTLNLFRWDALYSVKAAERGKVHEQEWAFSWTYARLLSFAGRRENSHLPNRIQH
jgi:phosphatidylinositol glycan class V